MKALYFLLIATQLLYNMISLPLTKAHSHEQKQYQQQHQHQQQTRQAAQQFIEVFNDFKRNHLNDELKYHYHYYIDDAAKNLQINHYEERHGDVVKGQYGLLEPNGNVRNVHYEVLGSKGFRTVIQTRTAASRTHQWIQHERRQPQVPVQLLQPVAYIV